MKTSLAMTGSFRRVSTEGRTGGRRSDTPFNYFWRRCQPSPSLSSLRGAIATKQSRLSSGLEIASGACHRARIRATRWLWRCEALFCLGRIAMDRIDPEHGFGFLHRLDVEIDGDRLAVAA